MQALTIHQPWASLIITGVKRFENRAWQTSYRGPFLVHAGKSESRLGWAEVLRRQGVAVPDELPMGVLLGTVDLIDCLPITDVAGEPFAEGPYCFKLSNPRAFKVPIPCRGKMGFFDVCCTVHTPG